MVPSHLKFFTVTLSLDALQTSSSNVNMSLSLGFLDKDMLSTWNQSVSQEIVHSLYYLSVSPRLVIWNVHDIGNPLLRLKLTINCKWEAKKPFKIQLIIWKALFLWEKKPRHWNFLHGTTFQWLHWYDCAIIWEADLSSHKTQVALLNRIRRNPVHNCDMSFP